MKLRLEDLPLLAVFAEVARAGSLSGAATALKISKSMVSRSLSRLETRLGTRLVHRTTRQLALSEAGEILLERARRMLEEAEAGLTSVDDLASTPRGTLRVNAPTSFGQLFVSPLLPSLLARHPALRVELTLEDRLADPVAERYDVVVRIGEVVSSSLAVRRLAPDRRVVVGSPEYFAHKGKPQTPDELTKHNCVRYAGLRREDEWRFNVGGAAVSIAVGGNLEVNHGVAQRDVVLRGVGIAVLPWFLVNADVRAGRLVTVLDSYELAHAATIHALYPRARPAPAKVRAFLDHLVEHLRAADLGG